MEAAENPKKSRRFYKPKIMKPSNSKKAVQIPYERTHFHFLIATNPNYFGNIPGSTIKPVKQFILDTSYEQITCLGYNPESQDMEATISIKKTTGYSGDLCTSGSLEYIRFYLDFHDGKGFIDQGSVAINVHNIPDQKDCDNQTIFPIKYTATLKKSTEYWCLCSKPVLPTLRAILSWGNMPEPDCPNWLPVWGNVVERDIQLKHENPDFLISKLHEISKFLNTAKQAPGLSVQKIGKLSGVDIVAFNPQPEPPLPELIKEAKKHKIPVDRFAYKTFHDIISDPYSPGSLANMKMLKEANIDTSSVIKKLGNIVDPDADKANVEYEELECLGLDYNSGSLVATFKIKKKFGYSGDLCTSGSKEYVAFWIKQNEVCSWQYLNTIQLNVHNLEMTGDSLYYSVSLPLLDKFYSAGCQFPEVIKARAVLSWNKPPSTTNPAQLEYYGNRIDAHVQLKPENNIEGAFFTSIGGVDIGHIDDSSGLTKPGAFFPYTSFPIPEGCAFGGMIVVKGLMMNGKYRFRIKNQTTGAENYLTDPLWLTGTKNLPPYTYYHQISPDNNFYYDFQSPDQNIENILARFTPGTNDKLLVEMEIEGYGTFSKVIQMDNTIPDVRLEVNDEGDCTFYKKGDKITGHYYVFDEHIRNWNFYSSWGSENNGTDNTYALPGNYFEIQTSVDANPCGAITLEAWDKTVVDSSGMRTVSRISYMICLRDLLVKELKNSSIKKNK